MPVSMTRRLVASVACLLIGLLAADIAFGAGCDPLLSGSAPTIASQAGPSAEQCRPSGCVSDCFCCSVVSSGGRAPAVLALGSLALSIGPGPAVTREGAPPLPYHPPLS